MAFAQAKNIGSVMGLRPLPATESARGRVAILGAAFVLGIMGDLLLRATPWGLNLAIWLGALCAVALALPRINGLRFSRSRGLGWLVLAFAFSLTLAWRSSPVLLTLNAGAVFACLGMVAFRSSSGALRIASVTEYVANAVAGIVQTIAGMAALLRELGATVRVTAGVSRRLVAVARGFAIAIVPLLVFGALFASADIFFRDLLRGVVSLSPAQFYSHIGLWIVFTWLSGSCLWGALLADRSDAPDMPRGSWLRFDLIEVGVVFGLIDALFLAFVGVQFRYLFGGARRVESSSSLTYAEYARRGFFELVAVAALVVPFLLFTHWLLPRAGAAVRRCFTIAAGLLIALVFVVMASALQRMRLYQQTFGLTELRVYTTAFMIWLFLVLAWLAITVLRGERDRFAFGVLVAALAVLIGLNALNPDAFIIRRNARIATDPQP
ncbi:MAG: DUF4173 domain-containing protein [Chloroflexi bacterium]|nr:DUF4173 domain-containing protein [Chloroflexota bacterium]